MASILPHKFECRVASALKQRWPDTTGQIEFSIVLFPLITENMRYLTEGKPKDKDWRFHQFDNGLISLFDYFDQPFEKTLAFMRLRSLIDFEETTGGYAVWLTDFGAGVIREAMNL
jgi:hypothetical protein